MKSILPAELTRIRIVLGGEAATVSWAPRTEGARERSGVIRVGRALLARHVRAGGLREIELADHRRVYLRIGRCFDALCHRRHLVSRSFATDASRSVARWSVARCSIMLRPSRRPVAVPDANKSIVVSARCRQAVLLFRRRTLCSRTRARMQPRPITRGSAPSTTGTSGSSQAVSSSTAAAECR